MANPIGTTIITADGINALSNASATGTKVQPTYFKYSNQGLILDPTLSSEDIIGWRTQDISAYQVFEKDGTVYVQFTCDVQPSEAIDYMRICGLYLADGTLFALGKPSFSMPPALGQYFVIQLTYSNISELMNFQYVSVDEEVQNLNALNFAVTQGELMIKNTLNIAKIKIEGVN